ncbi:thioredoxin [Steroidobacter denitrificans]|uniref:Thioredoxin n=1 Tax=Steroidobacter denitrificans TaxID=465721 RepID=A0A127F8D5_STEDE|nr:thioredoxin domain-containing protein [Steroidobacter denitrificans]AMN46693.1 thioredoxin [Steroidobacter denitrificans]
MQSSIITPHNRLADETSPYLLQHAGNPVDWYPWGEAAFQRACRENKPVLLSIGYSACHWCHVMAHESFEDPAVAALMNELFVNIKVDREERPDIDRIYQLAHQMLIQRGGGWPLTMFLSPDTRQPFFGGTYFPKEARFGLPAFDDLLQRVSEFYHSRSADIAQQGRALQVALEDLQPAPADREQTLSEEPLTLAREQLAAGFDAEFGGFGAAPKFPHPMNIDFLLRTWRASAGSETPDLHSLYMASLTLRRMAEGGIYDQLGGGFARYSVDRYWMIPHFEKMLYDNGQLLRIYANAALASGEPAFREVASQTADWIMREMQSSQGGYWSALDADSEGHEGRYYVWDALQVRALLPEDVNAVFARRFGLDRDANFEDAWHLHAWRGEEDIAQELELPAEEVAARLERARRILLDARGQRVRPARDEKILAARNGLAVAGMAVTARVLERPELTHSATQAIDFIHEHMWHEGRLFAAHKDGRARFPAYLDDHVFLIDALLELLQTRWRSEDLRFAIELAEILLTHFQDTAAGGFFFTADDHEALIHRSKSFADDALPAGNAIAAQVFTRLGSLLGETRYLDAAVRTLRAAWTPLQHYPQGHCAMLIALSEHLQPPDMVIIRGSAAEAARWRDEFTRMYAPRRLVFAIPDDAAALPPSLAQKRPMNETVAYICRGTTCSAPVRSLASLVALTR